jgi:hypothetical protein
MAAPVRSPNDWLKEKLEDRGYASISDSREIVTVAMRAGHRQLRSQLQQLADAEMACSEFKEGEIGVIGH